MSSISSKDVAELNPKLKNTQFADYHGHGWIFKAIFKKDKHGNLLDEARTRRSPRTIPIQVAEGRAPQGHPPRRTACSAWTAISCATCTVTARSTTSRARPRASSASTATARWTSGPTSDDQRQRRQGQPRRDGGTPFRPAVRSGNNSTGDRHADVNGQPRQLRHAADALPVLGTWTRTRSWEVPQTMDTCRSDFRPTTTRRSAYAKTLHRDGTTWGDVPADDRRTAMAKLAHNNEATSPARCATRRGRRAASAVTCR